MKRFLEKGFKGLMLIAAIAAGLSIGLFLCEKEAKAAVTVSANTVSANLVKTTRHLGDTSLDTYDKSGYVVNLELGYTGTISQNEVYPISSVKLIIGSTGKDITRSFSPINNVTVATEDVTGSVTVTKPIVTISDMAVLDEVYSVLGTTALTDNKIPGIKAEVTFDDTITKSAGGTVYSTLTSNSVPSAEIYHVDFTRHTGTKDGTNGFSGSGVSATSYVTYNITPKYSGMTARQHSGVTDVYCYKLENGSGTDTLHVKSTMADLYYENYENSSMTDARWGLSGRQEMTYSVSANSTKPVYYLPRVQSCTVTAPVGTQYLNSSNTSGNLTVSVETKSLSNGESDNNIVAQYVLENPTLVPSPSAGLSFIPGSYGDSSVNANSATRSMSVEVTASSPLSQLVTVSASTKLTGKKTNNDNSLGSITDFINSNTLQFQISPHADVNPTKTKAHWESTGNGFITVDKEGNLNSIYPIYSSADLKVADADVIWTEKTGDDKYVTLVNASGNIKGKAEGTASFTAKAKAPGDGGYTNISVSGTDVTVKIDVYPEPSIKYTSGAGSNRKLEITMPKKIGYKGLGHGDNFEDIKGFKLELLNSNKDKIAEYDLDKYKEALKSSSSSSYTTTYTVSGSDLEELVNKASSNGKFSSESQDVYFSVVPVGKQVKGTSTTVEATDFRKNTDAIKVYQVSASGENMETSTAYGLADQEVKLTATPKSGYSFSKWSDGSTINPRTVKVSSSTGSNRYTAVAGTRADAAGNGSDLSGYDEVPKTSENNSAIWLVVLMVFAVIGGGYALYIQFRPSEDE